MCAAAPATLRGGSRSSIRMIQTPPAARASSQLARAVASDPACSGPVGEGAKRPRYSVTRNATLALCDLLIRIPADLPRFCGFKPSVGGPIIRYHSNRCTPVRPSIAPRDHQWPRHNRHLRAFQVVARSRSYDVVWKSRVRLAGGADSLARKSTSCRRRSGGRCWPRSS